VVTSLVEGLVVPQEETGTPGVIRTPDPLLRRRKQPLKGRLCQLELARCLCGFPASWG